MTTRTLRLALAAVIGGLAALVAPSASAQGAGWWFQLGAYRPNIDSTLRVDDKGTGIGTNFDVENALGLRHRKTVPFALVGVRLGERWRIEVSHFALNRSVRGFNITENLVIDDTNYPLSASLDSDFDTKVTRVSGGYSLLKTDQAEFGVLAGVHVSQFELAVSGIGSAGGGGPVTLRRVQRDATVPLPTIGLFGSMNLAPAVELHGRANVFSLSHGGYEGRLLNLQASVVWRVTPNVGLGAGYRYNDYRLDADHDKSFSGRVEHKFRGPQVFADLRF